MVARLFSIDSPQIVVITNLTPDNLQPSEYLVAPRVSASTVLHAKQQRKLVCAIRITSSQLLNNNIE